jgi:hypothetical protein
MILKKKPQPKKKPTGPNTLSNIPSSEADVESAPIPEDMSEDGDLGSDLNSIDSWEDLPAGDYLDPDENGTVWFKANDGDNWYQNGDGTWTKWQD